MLYLIAGVICAVTLPWVLNGLAWVHHAVAKGMLGPWRTDALVQEVRAEAAARGAAVHAEDVSLRRLERDIHDGPAAAARPPADGPRRSRAPSRIR